MFYIVAHYVSRNCTIFLLIVMCFFLKPVYLPVAALGLDAGFTFL